MPKLPQIKPRDLKKILLKEGFSERKTKSSHLVFNHSDGRCTVIPIHNRPVRIGTLRAILRQAKITPLEFLKLL